MIAAVCKERTARLRLKNTTLLSVGTSGCKQKWTATARTGVDMQPWHYAACDSLTDQASEVKSDLAGSDPTGSDPAHVPWWMSLGVIVQWLPCLKNS